MASRMISFVIAICAIALLLISPQVQGKMTSPYFTVGEKYGIKDSDSVVIVVYDPLRHFVFRGKKQLALKLCRNIAADV